MRLTIVADDNCVGIEGEYLASLDLSQLDSSIHAVQWYGEYGEIEFKTVFENGVFIKPHNQIITDAAPFQFAINAWNAEKARIAATEAENQLPVTEV